MAVQNEGKETSCGTEDIYDRERERRGGGGGVVCGDGGGGRRWREKRGGRHTDRGDREKWGVGGGGGGAVRGKGEREEMGKVC